MYIPNPLEDVTQHPWNCYFRGGFRPVFRWHTFLSMQITGLSVFLLLVGSHS